MDASPVPRCNLNRVLLIVALFLAVAVLFQINVNTYAGIKDSNCLNFTSISDFEDIGITQKSGIFIIPICCCAFFALKRRQKKTEAKTVAPPSCRYAKILNC